MHVELRSLHREIILMVNHERCCNHEFDRFANPFEARWPGITVHLNALGKCMHTTQLDGSGSLRSKGEHRREWSSRRSVSHASM